MKISDTTTAPQSVIETGIRNRAVSLQGPDCRTMTELSRIPSEFALVVMLFFIGPIYECSKCNHG